MPGLAQKQGGPLFRFLTAAYPDHSWEPHRYLSFLIVLIITQSSFKISYKGAWKDENVVRRLVKDLETQFRLVRPEDWYHPLAWTVLLILKVSDFGGAVEESRSVAHNRKERGYFSRLATSISKD